MRSFLYCRFQYLVPLEQVRREGKRSFIFFSGWATLHRGLVPRATVPDGVSRGGTLGPGLAESDRFGRYSRHWPAVPPIASH